VLIQVAVYAGVPAGNRAFAVAQRALREQDALREQGPARKAMRPIQLDSS
jgi:hypothetical protein